MRNAILSTIVLAFLWPADQALADDLDPKVIVQKAYAAAGGEAAAKPETATWTDDASYYRAEDDVRHFTANCAFQSPNRYRMEIPGTYLMIVDGDKGWIVNSVVKEMSKEQLERQHEVINAVRVKRITALVHDEGYTVTLINDEKINDRPAYGLKITHDKHKDIDLYIDKENFLVVKKVQRMLSDETGKEAAFEDFYEDYQDFGGRKLAVKVTTFRDGQKLYETSMTDYKPAEKLDEKLFEKP